MKTYVFRLYPNKDQSHRLDMCLNESRALYNEMLERVKQHFQTSGRFLSKYDLTAAYKGRGGTYVPSTTVQSLADRLAKAIQKHKQFKDINRGGFPRFKSAKQWHSIQLRQWGTSKDAWLDGRMLRVPAKLGKAIKIKRHRELEGTPKTCYLMKRGDGHWYAHVVCEMPEPQPAPEPDNRTDIGIDLGLKVFLMDSNGNAVENPRYYRTSQATLRRKQRRLDARVKGSRRRRKAANEVAKTHLKITRQRRDFHFKTAKRYADNHRIIVVEDLNIIGLVQSNLAKSIFDVSWGAFLNILTDKAESAGGRVVRINPRFTTQKCYQCGELVQKSLSVRTHICPSCGYVADRDVNAAKNILKAGAPLSGTLADGLADEPRSP